MNKKTVYPIFTLLFFITLQTANGQTDPPARAHQTILNHIAVYVNDLAASTNFYRDVLKLEVMPEPFKDGKHTWFTLGPAGQLHLIAGAQKNVRNDKNSHICFSVKSIEDFIIDLEKHNIEYTNWPGNAKAPTVRVDGVKQVYFQDPDGYWIEVNDDYH